MRLLAGDVGGTKTNVALFEDEKPVRRATYTSAEHSGLEPILEDFLGTAPSAVVGACFGIAGPVRKNRCRTPNLPWEVDGDAVADRFGLPFLKLLNDLQATAEGIPALCPEDFTVLSRGERDPEGAAALIAAGTGLGMSVIPRIGGDPVPLPSEGGHMSFAPENEVEERLLAWLRKRYGHVSAERVVSGPGLANIHEFLTGEKGVDPAAVSPTARDIFLRCYGSAAGDLALLALARAGLYVGGGIVAKLLDQMVSGPFMEGFLDKGRFRPLLEKVPVLAIENPETAVLGAGRWALRRARRAT